MRFICTQDNLLGGVVAVSPLAGRNSQLPILQHVLIEVRDGVMYLTCTDLEVGARVVVTGKAETDGSCTVVARQLLDYVQQLPTTNPITIEVKKKKLSITTKGFSAQFSISEADDFPLLPTSPQTQAETLEGRLFCRALSQTIFAAARDEARPEIHSIFVKGKKGEVRVAATDSFRLAEYVISLDGGGSFSFLLPVATAQEVSRLFGDQDNIDVVTKENLVVFKSEGMYVSSRLVDGNYPDYQQIIPKSFSAQGTVRRDEFLRALKILSVLLPRDSRRVEVSVNPDRDRLELRAEGGEVGSGNVTLRFEGKGSDLKTLFNVHYLLDGVVHNSGEVIDLSFGGESDPVVLRPNKDTVDQLYIVMPIQA